MIRTNRDSVKRSAPVIDLAAPGRKTAGMSTTAAREPGARLLTAGAIVAAATGVGVLTIGVLSRLMMFLFARLNPEADGVTSDDGFEMGRFTATGSLNLALVGLVFGVLSGLLYLLLEGLLVGPEWFRTLSLSVGAGTVGAANLVHADGVDFTLLDPLWLTVGLCTLLPVLHVAAVHLVAQRVRSARGVPSPSAPAALGWVLRVLLAALFVLAVASLVSDVSTLSR